MAHRAFHAKIDAPDTAPVAEHAKFALHGDFGDAPVIWTVADHPPDPGLVGDHPPDPGLESDHPPNPGLVSCVAGFGPEAVFSATRPGVYVVRALVLDPESLALRSWVDTELYVEGDDLSAELLPTDVMSEVLEPFDTDEQSGIDPTPFIDWDEVAGIEPTPFYDEGEVSGIDPTPFHGALLFGENMSLSAGCLVEG